MAAAGGTQPVTDAEFTALYQKLVSPALEIEIMQRKTEAIAAAKLAADAVYQTKIDASTSYSIVAGQIDTLKGKVDKLVAYIKALPL